MAPMNRIERLARNASLALVALGLAACAAEAPQSVSPLHTNDLLKYVPWDPLAWSLSTKSRLRESLTPEGLHGRLLGLIAYHEARTAKPCRNLALQAIAQLPAEPFSAKGLAAGPDRTYRPDKYLERWTVATCGRPVNWLIFDDLDDKAADLTLLRALEAS